MGKFFGSKIDFWTQNWLPNQFLSLFDFSIFQEKRRLERGPTPEEERGRPDELDRWDIKKKKIEHLEAVDVIF